MGFICIVLLYLLFARLLSSITVNKEQSGTKSITMYIHTNGMHTDYVFPIKSKQIDWNQIYPITDTKGQNHNQNYIAIGWGDKGFFLDVEDWNNVKPKIALNAAFGLGSTAIHITYYNSIQIGEHTREIKISEEQYKHLIDFILSSTKIDKDTSRPIVIVTDKVYGQNDSFYVANGKYSFLNTCNTWANKGLKKAKMKSCYWTAFQEGIFRKYE